MDDNTCERCGQTFARAANLRRHLARKTPCVLIVDRPGDETKPACRFCNRTFASRANLTRHMKAACPIAPNKRNGEAGMMVLYEHTKQRQPPETVERLEAKIDELERRLMLAIERGGAPLAEGCGAGEDRGISGAVGTVVSDNRGTVNSVTNVMTNVMVINNFGSETAAHATGAKIREIMDETLAGAPAMPAAAQAAVLKAALLIFSNPDHPENLTAYLPNKKRDDVMVHGDKGWEVQPASLVLAPIALKSLDILFDNQPYEDAKDYEGLMVELRDNEARYRAGEKLRPILVRNKDLLMMALGTLPVAATGAGASAGECQ